MLFKPRTSTDTVPDKDLGIRAPETARAVNTSAAALTPKQRRELHRVTLRLNEELRALYRKRPSLYVRIAFFARAAHEPLIAEGANALRRNPRTFILGLKALALEIDAVILSIARADGFATRRILIDAYGQEKDARKLAAVLRALQKF